jgi:uncharacterized membrane protein YfcA
MPAGRRSRSTRCPSASTPGAHGDQRRLLRSVNYVKLVPYSALGQFDARNLGASALLAPLAVAFTFAGAAIIRRMRAEVFYPVTYALTALVGLKLVWDGLAAL